MNKKGQLEMDFDEPATWIALGLALLGAFGSWWYAGYLDTGAGIMTKLITAVLTAGIGYVVAMWILTK